MPKLFSKIFGTHSERELRAIEPIIVKIEGYADEYRALSDEQLRAKTDEFKQRLANGSTLDDILPEAFAVAREASDRVLGERPYRVQLIGGVVLHQGRIAEMKTGEGKTLVAVMPSYLNALAGKGVHVVTVNDYLAKRDSEWMGKVHRFLGLTVGLIIHEVTPGSDERRASYNADITYGTNNEFGFDYLRDNVALYKASMVQRGHSFAIVDEVDSILVDEARTPLILSEPGDESTDMYTKVNDFVARLRSRVYTSIDEKSQEDEDIDVDFVIDEKAKTATLTARGTAKAESHFGLENLADLENNTLSHHINMAVRAHGVYKRDIDYVVNENNEVVIVDEFTGRLMVGRRYNGGQHQAIEAKEHVVVERESKTRATITFQNYFRLYDKLSGMTGTALTEAEEFGAIYKLDIIEIPTNKPIARDDHTDAIYKSEEGKYRAIVTQIEECKERGQPVLVGTVSIEKSEFIEQLLKRRGIKSNVLNAKNHEREAEIVAQAGMFGAITVATNMAGRGTDIKLGGNAEFRALNDLRREGVTEELIVEANGHSETDDEEILAVRGRFNERLAHHKKDTDANRDKVIGAGGLFIIGTERHESRRIDNQLRGRAGRQGDPGDTRFYISMTDDIMRLFGSERIIGMMDTLKIDEDTPIDQKIITNAIETAQKKVESRNFQSRKAVLEYDDVMNMQRTLIYEQRAKVLDGEDLKSHVLGMIDDTITASVMGAEDITDAATLREATRQFEGLFVLQGELKLDGPMKRDALTEMLKERARLVYNGKEATLGELPDGTTLMRELERVVLLRVVDEYWMEHIDAMEELREGVRLRAYGQVNPVDEYKREGFDMFEAMISGIKDEVTRRVFTAQVRTNTSVERKGVTRNLQARAANAGGDGTVKKQPVKAAAKVGRNDPCPCGARKEDGTPVKYKNCHGRDA